MVGVASEVLPGRWTQRESLNLNITWDMWLNIQGFPKFYLSDLTA